MNESGQVSGPTPIVEALDKGMWNSRSQSIDALLGRYLATKLRLLESFFSLQYVHPLLLWLHVAPTATKLPQVTCSVVSPPVQVHAIEPAFSAVGQSRRFGLAEIGGEQFIPI